MTAFSEFFLQSEGAADLKKLVIKSPNLMTIKYDMGEMIDSLLNHSSNLSLLKRLTIS